MICAKEAGKKEAGLGFTGWFRIDIGVLAFWDTSIWETSSLLSLDLLLLL